MLRIAAALGLSVLLVTGAAWGQTTSPPNAGEKAAPPAKGAPTPAIKPTPSKPAPAASTPGGSIPLEQALYLIRTTLLTLNDANRSGNYTVLRDLAAPGFQAKNSAADLGAIFQDIRARKVDLGGAALLSPQLASPPAAQDGRLRLSGTIPTEPLLIAFDLLFDNIGGQWRLFGIGISTPKREEPVARK